MSEMVGIVTLAIFRKMVAHGFEIGDGDNGATIKGEINLRVLARAAIEAMREPTHEMQVAGYCRPHDWKLVFPLGVWMHMIDEALK